MVAGQDGRGFGEAGCGLLGGHQDLRARKGLVRGCGSPGPPDFLTLQLAGTHPGPAPAAAPGTRAQPLAISADW